MNRFIKQMGGMKKTSQVIDLLREKAVKAGLPGVHVNAIWYDVLDSNPQCSECPQQDWVSKIGLDSYTSYNDVCISKKWISEFPRVNYRQISDDYLAICAKAQASLPAPYYPVVTVAWDSSPRTIQSEVYDSAPSYPYLPVMESSPEMFCLIRYIGIYFAHPRIYDIEAYIYPFK